LNDEIIEWVAQSQKIVPHFHIPLQSGSDTLLKSMRRKYLTALYTSRVEKIKQLMPHCCIGVDVIVGFPGETEALFLETYQYLNQLPISYLHVFTYSERENTTAFKLPEKVPMQVRADRSKMLHILSDKKRRAFYEEHIGNTYPVLWEAESDGNAMFGFTSNYIKVKTAYEPAMVNEISMAKLTEIDAEMVMECKNFLFEPSKV
jgi:threonylcarbamoyladenosine tRNA methylthiotransferase MtaB